MRLKCAYHSGICGLIDVYIVYRFKSNGSFLLCACVNFVVLQNFGHISDQKEADMSETFKIAGFEIAKADGLLYLDWFLLVSMVFIVYAAWKGGQRREKRERSRSVSERPEQPMPEKVATPAKPDPGIVYF